MFIRFSFFGNVNMKISGCMEIIGYKVFVLKVNKSNGWNISDL